MYSEAKNSFCFKKSSIVKVVEHCVRMESNKTSTTAATLSWGDNARHQNVYGFLYLFIFYFYVFVPYNTVYGFNLYKTITRYTYVQNLENIVYNNEIIINIINSKFSQNSIRYRPYRIIFLSLSRTFIIVLKARIKCNFCYNFVWIAII